MVANEHNRNDESHKGKIGICIFCIQEDQENEDIETTIYKQNKRDYGY